MLGRSGGIVLVALALGLAGCGGSGTSGNQGGGGNSSSSYNGPPAKQLQSTLVKDAKSRFSAPTAASASCAMPNTWKTGVTFKCFVYNSGGSGVGDVTITVLPDKGNEWEWNESWTALAGGATASTPTPSPAATPPSTVIFTVTGSAPPDSFGDTVNISYGSDTINDAGGTSVPWSASLPYVNPASDANLEYNLSADLTSAGGSITCSISVDGQTFSSTANGADQGCYEEVSPNLLGSGWVAD